LAKNGLKVYLSAPKLENVESKDNNKANQGNQKDAQKSYFAHCLVVLPGRLS